MGGGGGLCFALLHCWNRCVVNGIDKGWRLDNGRNGMCLASRLDNGIVLIEGY